VYVILGLRKQLADQTILHLSGTTAASGFWWFAIATTRRVRLVESACDYAQAPQSIVRTLIVAAIPAHADNSGPLLLDAVTELE
jgi:hypothetical protein